MNLVNFIEICKKEEKKNLDKNKTLTPEDIDSSLKAFNEWKSVDK